MPTASRKRPAAEGANRRERGFSLAAFSRALIDAPRWLFLATLLYAPWAFGCTEPAAIVGLNLLLGATLILWCLTLLARRQVPLAPRMVCLLAVLLLIQGWGMTLNARSFYDPLYYVFVLLPGSRPALPGSVEGALSFQWMVRGSLLLGSLLFAADLVQRSIWQLRLWHTLGLAGASIALLGLIQKVAQAPMIFWLPEDIYSSFFATYFYHANAGAFLNLILPPVTGLTLRAIAQSGNSRGRALWISALAIVLTAEAVNTSRAAQIIAMLLGAALLAGPVRKLLAQPWHLDRTAAIIYGLIGLVSAAALIYAIGPGKALMRWQNFDSGFFNSGSSRLLAAQAGLSAAPDAGWFGFGPGVFRVVFPYFTGDLGESIPGIWEQLHQDYLQTVIEWGWVGAACWGGLFFGGIGAAAVSYRRHSKAWIPRQRLLLTTLGLALAGVSLHALVDFPLQIASLQLYCMTYLGVCWGSLSWVPASDADARQKPTLRAP